MLAIAPRTAPNPRPTALPRRWISWFAALCLVLGQLHVWQHRAERDDHGGHDDHADHGGHDHHGDHGDGHFDPGSGEACLLADTPWTDMPAAPCAPGYEPALQRAVPTPARAAGSNPAARPPIRAPPPPHA